MYSDAKKRRRWPLAAAALLLAVVILAAGRTGRSAALDEESASAIREAVRRSALQCYVVEGVYPPSLAYLTENYGLQVNTEDFYVTYDAFASNLPPTVRVTARQHS
ncbi:MAG: hypothetical protein IJ221_00775 [Oscillibacter sp.]|nr:hypothetical protein [Oscillibacter sp.]